MDFRIATRGHFKIEQCYDCRVPGYLIVSPVNPVSSLAELQRNAQEELGPILAVATEAIRNVVAPVKIYCAQFGEEGQQLHFHVFPRTAEVTNEFLRTFPEQRELIHGPLLLDWARSKYRATQSDVWKAVSPIVSALQEEITRITSRSAERAEHRHAPLRV